MRYTSKLFALLVLFLAARPATAETASVTLKVPVGATLTINGHHTHQMTATRLFVTPDLPAGKLYRYVFVATFTWNGEEVTRKKQLDLSVGQSYTVDMFTADPVKKPVPVEEPEVKPVSKVEQPTPAPKPSEVRPTPPPPPPVEPKPAPKAEVPPPPVEPKPKPNPEPPTNPFKPKEPVAQPERQVAPKPREVKPKR